MVDDLGVSEPSCTPASAGILLPDGKLYDDCGDTYAPIVFFILFKTTVQWWLVNVFTGVLVHVHTSSKVSCAVASWPLNVLQLFRTGQVKSALRRAFV